MSPGTRSLTWRKSAWWLVRWPATTTLPTCPGIADPGQWPGPGRACVNRIPSYSVASIPSFGMAIRPSWPRFSAARGSCGGAIGWVSLNRQSWWWWWSRWSSSTCVVVVVEVVVVEVVVVEGGGVVGGATVVVGTGSVAGGEAAVLLRVVARQGRDGDPTDDQQRRRHRSIRTGGAGRDDAARPVHPRLRPRRMILPIGDGGDRAAPSPCHLARRRGCRCRDSSSRRRTARSAAPPRRRPPRRGDVADTARTPPANG